jgi:hypothetical protein
VATTNENAQHHGDDQPTHFVVELKTEDGVRYAICERLMIAGAGHGSLPSAVLEEFLNRHPLRAAAIPGDSSGSGRPPWLAQAMVGQSGVGPIVNVTINNKD